MRTFVKCLPTVVAVYHNIVHACVACFSIFATFALICWVKHRGSSSIREHCMWNVPSVTPHDMGPTVPRFLPPKVQLILSQMPAASKTVFFLTTHIPPSLSRHNNSLKQQLSRAHPLGMFLMSATVVMRPTPGSACDQTMSCPTRACCVLGCSNGPHQQTSQ